MFAVRVLANGDNLFEGISELSGHDFLVKLCENVPEMGRARIVDDMRSIRKVYETEEGKNTTEVLTLLASQLHVLYDIFEKSDDANEQFAARCDHYATSLDDGKVLFDDQALALFAMKFFKHLNKLCYATPMLKHEDVSKLAEDFANKNLPKEQWAKKKKVLSGTHLILHLLLVRYDIQSARDNFKTEDFTNKCKDPKQVLALLLMKE